MKENSGNSEERGKPEKRKKRALKLWPERLGTRHLMNNGNYLTVIGYSRSRYTVRFDNGVEKTVPWQCIEQGVVSEKIRKMKKDISAKYVGRTKVMANGYEARIINYTNDHDIDVEFLYDGSTVKTYLDRFNNGLVSTPSIRKITCRKRSIIKKEKLIGMSRLQKHGMTAIITGVNHDGNLILTFNTGSKKVCKAYSTFRSGKVSSKENLQMAYRNRIGTVMTNSEGERAEVVEYNSSTDVIVRFDDGTTKRLTWGNFVRKNFRKASCASYGPRAQWTEDDKQSLTNTTYVMNGGHTIRILKVIDWHNIWIVTQSGYLRKTTWGNIKNRTIADKPSKKFAIEVPADLRMYVTGEADKKIRTAS